MKAIQKILVGNHATCVVVDIATCWDLRLNKPLKIQLINSSVEKDFGIEF